MLVSYRFSWKSLIPLSRLLTGDSWLTGPNAPSPDGSTPGAPMMQHEGQNAWFNVAYQAAPNSSTLGPVVATEVQLGSLTVPRFGVGVATQLGFNYPLEGFMGLAFKGLNTGMSQIPQVGAKVFLFADSTRGSPTCTAADVDGSRTAASPEPGLHRRSETEQPGQRELRLR